MADGASLWSVALGGALAVAGGVLTSAIALFGKFRESSEERKKRRAEKFGELVEAVYAFDHWLVVKGDVTAFGHKQEVGPSPIAKVEAIAAVHFPSFKEAIRALVKGAAGYQLWMLNAGQKRALNEPEKMGEGMDEAYVPYINARDNLLEELRVFGEREFK